MAAANDEAGALNRRNQAFAGLDAGWYRAQQEFGLDGGFNDYQSNPYSRAALLQRSYDNAKRGTLNSAGNQLYAGSYVNSQNANTHSFDLGRNELQNAYARSNAEYVGNRQQAENEYQEALAQAAWRRIQAALESQPEPMPSSGGGDDGGGAPSGGQGRQKKQPRKEQIKQGISNRRKAR